MTQYLLDTNIIIYLFKSKYRIHEKMVFVGLENCFISEITLAELKIGAEKSNNPLANHHLIITLIQTLTVLPIADVLDVFAFEKVRLEKEGTPMHDNFDVLIASTAMINNLVMVTHNVRHFTVYPNLVVEDWTDSNFPSQFV